MRSGSASSRRGSKKHPVHIASHSQCQSVKTDDDEFAELSDAVPPRKDNVTDMSGLPLRMTTSTRSWWLSDFGANSRLKEPSCSA
eukprot:COSAG03_NODE_302_length_9200_cov_3.491704_2_plen_85_part_00